MQTNTTIDFVCDKKMVDYCKDFAKEEEEEVSGFVLSCFQVKCLFRHARSAKWFERSLARTMLTVLLIKKKIIIN